MSCIRNMAITKSVMSLCYENVWVLLQVLGVMQLYAFHCLIIGCYLEKMTDKSMLSKNAELPGILPDKDLSVDVCKDSK